MKNIKYYSSDKLYYINNKKLNLKIWRYLMLTISSIFLLFSVLNFMSSVKIGEKNVNSEYCETGKADYLVYLKDNDFYNTKYLGSGMQYIASIINTINAKFNYEIHSDENLNFKYDYEILGHLEIIDKDSNKVLYQDDEILLNKKKMEIKSNNIVVNEDVIIDYDKYNSLVKSYKSKFGVSVNAYLHLIMNINVHGDLSSSNETLDKSNILKVSIPLSEQTINIDINGSNINNSDNMLGNNHFRIVNLFNFVLSIILLSISFACGFFTYILFRNYNIKNIYNITLNKFLKEYDQLIVNGTASIDEKKYTNIIYPKSFEELVDAASNLNVPIVYYEVIPGEKSFFIITYNDTLYKFRLTKAYLENQK